MRRSLWLLPLQMNLLILPICALLMFAAAPAWSDLNRDDAAATAQRISGGRVLSVEKFASSRAAVWRIKVLTARGEVRVILIDLESVQAAFMPGGTTFDPCQPKEPS